MGDSSVIPIGSLIGGILIDTIGGTATLAVMGATMCTIALVFTQVRGLRRASLAPLTARAPEAVLAAAEGFEL